MTTTMEQAADKSSAEILREVAWFALHTVISLSVLYAVVYIITLTGTRSFSMPAATTLALVIPGAAGFMIAKLRNDHVAPYVWISGLVWFSIICVWVLDMPTGPGLCEKCGASDKLYLTFFNLTTDSGLIDGMGRLVGTWPTLAMVGYGLGARLAMKKANAAIER